MNLLISLTEVGRTDVGLKLGGDETFVTELFLHAADVGAAGEEMSREAVPERVRASAHD